MTLAQDGALVQGDVDAVCGIVTAVHPALERRPQEARRDLGVVNAIGLRLEPALPGDDMVLEHGRAEGVEVEDVEVIHAVELPGLGIRLLQQLGELVVGHRLGSVDVPV